MTYAGSYAASWAIEVGRTSYHSHRLGYGGCHFTTKGWKVERTGFETTTRIQNADVELIASVEAKLKPWQNGDHTS